MSFSNFHAIHVNIILRLDAIYDIKAIDPPTPLALTDMVMQSLQGMVSSRLSYSRISYIVICLLHSFLALKLLSQLNSSVYFRPRYNAYRANHPTENRLSCLLHVLKISSPGNCWKKTLHDIEESEVTNTDSHEISNKAKRGDVDQIITELPDKV